MCRGGNGALRTRITDVEGELDGPLTYDRRVMKPDAARVKAAHEDLIRVASRTRSTGRPAAEGAAR